MPAELCISGYGCEDAFQSPDVQRMALTLLSEIVPHTRGLIVSAGLPLVFRHALFNTACLMVNARLPASPPSDFLRAMASTTSRAGFALGPPSCATRLRSTEFRFHLATWSSIAGA